MPGSKRKGTGKAVGRPSKLTPALQAKIVRLVEGGNYLETAAEANGIMQSTLHLWLRKGRDGEPVYSEFSEAVARARAKAEAALVSKVRRGTNDRGAAWLLERTRGKKFQARVAVKVEAELEMFFDVAQRVLAPEDFERLVEGIAALDREGEAAGDPGAAAPAVH